MSKGKKWTEEDVELLEEKWGTVSLTRIAKVLGRTETSILNKVQRLGLGRHLDNSEYVSINQLFKALGRPWGASYTKKQWIKKGLPTKNKKVRNESFKVIDIDEFWKWAEKNRMLIDFSRVAENILGIEPDWVKDQRKADVSAKKYRGRPWTKEEDSLLQSMLKHYKFSYRDLSIRLKRTEGAIKRRMSDLNIKERPLKANNHNPWTDEEIDILLDMYSKGYIPEVIAEKIDRSALAIRGKIERMIYEEKLKPRMECRKVS